MEPDLSSATHMVDVSSKTNTLRSATAFGQIFMQAETLRLILEDQIPKGDVLTTAQVAGVMGAKRCWELIPLCHPLPISSVRLDLVPQEAQNCLNITATVKVTGKTGVEMEALTAVSLAALTVYDMCKAHDPEMVIGNIQLKEKQGGRSGHFKASSLFFR